MEFSITFIKILFAGIYLLFPTILILFTTIMILGQIVGRLESWPKFDALYWALITALTVGYGDIRPQKNASRVFSIFIAILGIMLAGILVAITVEAASKAFEMHSDPAILERISRGLRSMHNTPMHLLPKFTAIV